MSVEIKETRDSICLQIGENSLTLKQWDVADVKADAIVCPVNPNLDMNSGVAQAIVMRAGKNARSQTPHFPEPYGKVVVLPGGNLHAKYIFLTVLLGENVLEKKKFYVKQAVERAIRYAEFLRLKSLAFPVLGSAKEAVPYDSLAREMLERVIQYFSRRNTKLKTIFFSTYNDQAFETFRKEAKELANP